MAQQHDARPQAVALGSGCGSDSPLQLQLPVQKHLESLNRAREAAVSSGQQYGVSVILFLAFYQSRHWFPMQSTR